MKYDEVWWSVQLHRSRAFLMVQKDTTRQWLKSTFSMGESTSLLLLNYQTISYQTTSAYWCLLMLIDAYWCLLMLIDAYWCLLIIVFSSVSQTWMWVQSLSKRGKNMAFQRVGNMTLKMRRSCQWSQSCFWVEKFCTSGAEGTSKTVQISSKTVRFFFSVRYLRPLSDAEPVTPAEPVARWGPGTLSHVVSSCSVYVGYDSVTCCLRYLHVYTVYPLCFELLRLYIVHCEVASTLNLHWIYTIQIDSMILQRFDRLRSRRSRQSWRCYRQQELSCEAKRAGSCVHLYMEEHHELKIKLYFFQ